MCGAVFLGWLALSASGQSEDTFLSNTRQLTFEGKRSGEGYFSADGRALIFQSEREADNPFYQIYVLDMETGETSRVSPGVGKTTCGFLRPGTDEVLFASTHLDAKARDKQKAEFEFRASGKERRYSWDYDEEMDIFAGKRDSTNLRRLTTTPGYDAEGAFSPDGSKIVFCSLRDAYPTNQLSAADLKRLETDPAYFGEIYIMNADGTEQRRLTTTPGYDGGPFFSPDGQRIVWRHFDTNGVIADVFTMKLDGSDVRRITDFGCMSWAPFFHPSGEYLTFTANKLGFANFELFIADAQGQHEPVRITHTDGFDGLPSFSPDGKRLTWTSARGSDGKSQIYLADWNHNAAMQALVASRPRIALAHGHSHETAVRAATNTPVAVRRLSNDVAFLSSPRLAGRMTGSPGAQEAAEFIAARLEVAGVKPLGEKGTYFDEFEFNAGVRVLTNGNLLTIKPKPQSPPLTFQVEKDFRPLSFTSNGVASGEVVFAGYGLSVPGKAGEGYDSYAALNVSNRIVLVLRYVPEEVEAKRRQELNRYAGLRYKAMIARERGAKAILFVTGPNSPNAGQLAALSSDSGGANSGIIAASVTTDVAAAVLGAAGKDLKAIQSQLDKEDPHAIGSFAISNATLSLTAAVEHIRKTDRNVVGILPAGNNAPKEYVLVGAHYDHLGLGESGAMQRAGEENQIHPGADDNASGSAVLMQLAREIAEMGGGTHAGHDHPPGQHAEDGSSGLRRGIIFAFWSGEELGLLGSAHFAEHSPSTLR